MNNLSIRILDANKKIIAEKSGSAEVNLVYEGSYMEGMSICVDISEKNCFYWVKLDDAKEKALLYVTDSFAYAIPFGEKRINVSPKVFLGQLHHLHIRKAYDFELDNYRNIAFNPWDQHGNVSIFPHASANVETRGESVFAALNAIDGCTVSNSHGAWPYQSWGINQNPDAVLKIDFGKTVTTDRLIMYTRADYPHDNWWEAATVVFSDGSSLPLKLVKTGEAQLFTFKPKHIQWLEIANLKKADDPSPFPALTQIEVYGTYR